MKTIICIGLAFFISSLAMAQSAEYTSNKNQKLSQESPFQKIVKRELPATIEYEDEEIIAFIPLSPQAPVHILVVPKKRIPTINDIEKEDAELIGNMFLVAKKLATEKGIAETGYRLAFNTNEHSGQSVFHIHLHLMGGIALGPMVSQEYRESQKSDKEK